MFFILCRVVCVCVDHVCIADWDTSSVTDFSFFAADSILNSDISTWDVSQCVEFEAMFSSAVAFSQDVSNCMYISLVSFRAYNPMNNPF